MNRNFYNRLLSASKHALQHLSENQFSIPLMVPGASRVLLYHRFSRDYDSNGVKIDADTFEWQLRILKNNWHVISLGDLFDSLHKGQKLPTKTVVITVDDGYLDFYQVAYPLLLKYGLTATFFPTLHFVEGQIWLWPDMLSYVLEKCVQTNLLVSYENRCFGLPIKDPVERAQSWQQLSDFCSELADDRKWDFIQHLSELADVNLPDKPVAEYAAVSFEHLKEMSCSGIEIGAHTLNHPILTRVDDATLKRELCEPKRILESRLGIEVKSLAYPSGRQIDISPTVIDAAQECGYAGAVVTRRQLGHYDTTDRYQLPRIGIGNDKADFCWKLQGFELLAEAARARLLN